MMTPLQQIISYYKRIGFQEGERFIIRASGTPQIILFGEIGESNIRLWNTEFYQTQDKLATYRQTQEIPDPVAKLRELGETHDIQSYPNHISPREHSQFLTLGSFGNKDAKVFNSFFWEIDDLPLDEQRRKREWFTQATGIDVAVSVYSGGKSIHKYIALTRPCTSEEWTRISRKLCIVMQSDTAIVTPARAMRLPGVPRIKNGVAREVEIVHESDFKVDPEVLEVELDKLQDFPYGISDEHWKKLKSSIGKGKGKGKGKDKELTHQEYWDEAKKLLTIPEDELFPKPKYESKPSSIEFNYSGDTIPLEFFLTRDDQSLINSGVIAGSVGRNPMGFKLACNLIATANQLDKLGIRHTNNARQLLEDYCGRCNPALPTDEIDRIWNQAFKSELVASVKDNSLKGRASYWEWKKNFSLKYEEYLQQEAEQELIKEAEEEYRKEQEKENYEMYKRNLEIFHKKILLNGIKLNKIRDSQEELLPIFPELETKQGKDWLKMRKFTPDKVIESKYFDWEPNSSDTNLTDYAIKAGLGEGKSTWAHNTFLAETEKGANAFAHRNVLLRQFGKRGNDVIKSKGGTNSWYHLQTDLQTQQQRFLLNNENARISACVDSLPYFQPDAFVKKRLVLDEIEATFKHLYQSKTAVSYKRPLCKKRIGEAIEHSEATAILDGNLSDITVAHAERISGKRFFKIENKGTGKKRNVILYNGSVTHKKNKETGEIEVKKKLDDYSLLHRIMVTDQDPLICASDAQEKLESWQALLEAKGHKVFRLDGTNSKSLEAQIFLDDPEKFIRENKITAFLYSPTAECGISVDLHNYFKRAYFFFFGIAKTKEQNQFLDRIRDKEIDAHVFSNCKAMNSQTPQASEEIQKYLIQYASDCSEISLSDLGDEEKSAKMLELAKQLREDSTDPHFLYECQLIAQQAFESANLRKCLEYALREAGYSVKVVVGYQESKKDLQITQRNNQVVNSQQIVTAKDITAQEENNIIKDEIETLNKFESAQDAKRAIVKRRLLQRLPGIEQKTQTKVIYVDVPQDVVKDIEAGQVSPEIAQKLGVVIPETKPTPDIEPVHLLQNDYKQTEEGGQLNIWDNHQPAQAEISHATEPETLTEKAVTLVHLPQNISIKTSEGGQAPDTCMVRLEVTQTDAPVFDSDFVHRVLYKDRHLLSAVTLHFLLNKPTFAKLLQQRKWYKLLDNFTDPDALESARNMSLTTYKSRWLQVYTLMQMGIEFFLKPGAVWTDETPEAISFWEKGKNEKTAKYIGVSVGKDGACAYIGRVLKTLDIKTKSKKLPKQQSTGKRPNSYRIDQDYLDSPMRKAIYECVEESITKKVESADFIIDWDSILRNQQSLEPETLTDKAVDFVHLPPNISIKTTEGGQATDTDLDFCLSGLATLEAALESPESSSLTNSDKVSALFSEMEMREERCNNKLSESFWNRAVRLVSLLFERFESKKQEVLSTQDIELSNEDDEEEDIIVTNPRTFIYKGKDYSTHTFNNLGRKIFVTIAQGTVLKEVLGADMCDLLWTTVTTELLNNLEPITVDFKDLQLV